MNDQEIIDNLEMLKDLDFFDQEDAEIIQALDEVSELPEQEKEK